MMKIKILSVIVLLAQINFLYAADQRIQWSEEMVGAGHPTKSDTLNRLSIVEHNTDGTHKEPLSNFTVEHNSTGTHAKMTKVVDPYIDARAYASVNAAVAAAQAGAIKTVIVFNIQTLSASLAVPSGVNLVVYNGGYINKASSYTLTFDAGSTFESGIYRAFNGFSAGEVLFNNKIDIVYPQWFGVVGDGSDETSKLQTCISSVVGVDNARVFFGKGVYGATTLTLPDNAVISLIGVGEEAIIKHLVSSSPLLGNSGSGSIANLNISNLTFDGNQANQTDWETRMLQVFVDKCFIGHCNFINGVHTAINFSDIITKATVDNCRFSGMREHDGTSNHDTTMVLVNGTQATPPEFVFTNNYCSAATPSTPGSSPGGVCVSYDFGTYTDQIRCVVKDNIFINIGQARGLNYISPVHFYTDVSTGIISGNLFQNCYYRAIQAQRSQDIIITDNLIDVSLYTPALGDNDAIISISNRATTVGSVFPRQRYLICKNKIYNCPGFIGIRAAFDTNKYGGQIIVQENVIDTAAAGVVVSYVDGEVFVKNNIIRNLDNAGYGSLYKGIYVYDVNNKVDVSNNTVEYALAAGTTSQGIFIDRLAAVSDAPAIVHGNVLNRCADNVVNVRNMLVNMSDNIVQSATTYAYDVQNCDYANLYGNYAPGTTTVNPGTTTAKLFHESGNTWLPIWSAPAQITTNQDNYNPDAFNRWKLTSDASRDITGIASRPIGGKISVVNAGSFDIVFKYQSGTSTAANRIITYSGADVTLNAFNTAELLYDTTSSRWRLLGKN